MTTREEIVLAALRERRSAGKLKPDDVPRALIQRIIQAGTWAPNHRLTEPWRFIVLTGGARSALGDVMARPLREKLPEGADERAWAQIEKVRNKPLRAPVVIAVAAVPSPDPRVVEAEEVAAVAAAVQNMLLAAEALGLGAIWRTGEAVLDPAVKRFLDLPPEAHLVAFVYLGYPEFAPRREREGDGSAHIRWMSDEK